MKNPRFPVRLSSVKRSLRITPLRLALAVALVGMLCYLPFYAGAQGVLPAKPPAEFIPYTNGGGAYVLSQLPNGDTTCRAATWEETRIMRDGRSERNLRPINHLPSKGGSQSIESASGLTIILRATPQLEADPVAKQAFIAAAAKWEALIKDPITINIDVDYGPTHFGQPFNSANTLGSTLTSLYSGAYAGFRSRLVSHASSGAEATLINSLPSGAAIPTDSGNINTLVVAAPLLRALGGLPAVADPNETDAPQIGFNSAFGFDFDPSDGITGNRTDFDAVAVHEIGHALGFDSWVGAAEMTPAQPNFAAILDLFRFRPGTANSGNFSSAERILHSGGTQVYFGGGGSELGLSTARPDGTGGDTWQAGHWRDDQNILANFIGIMDPNISRNRRETMTANDIHAMDYIGYTLTPLVAPANDNFASAQALTGCSGTVAGTNVNATEETGEPDHASNGGTHTVWYQWQAPSSSSVTFTTAGSNYDTVMAAYTGNAVGSLSLITSNDDTAPGVTSSIIFSATAGTVYRIAVAGFNNTGDGDTGVIQLNWNAPGCTTSVPPSIQMELATYNFSEGVGNAQVHVKRTGDTTGASSINFSTGGNSFFACSTINGSAVQNCDFILNQGTLAFAAGQTDRSINILINDDTYVEGNETLTLTLSTPVNATLGTPGSATLTITDNDSAGATVPGAKTFIAALNAASEVPPTGTSGKGGGMVQLDAGETGGKAGLLFSSLSSAET
ncbi:MAG: hypothetical protein QOE77_3213, partial [Blastocatellia bacterium]|nr:hypothetical protein [Blastocatellia bacterium]